MIEREIRRAKEGDQEFALMVLEEIKEQLSKKGSLDDCLAIYLNDCIGNFLVEKKKTNKNDVVVRSFASSFNLVRKKGGQKKDFEGFYRLATDIHLVVLKEPKGNVEAACKTFLQSLKNEGKSVKEKYGLLIDPKRIRQIYDKYISYALKD